MTVSKAEIERRMERFGRMCRAKGRKATHQRREVFLALAADEAHPDAETIYRRVRQRVPTISRDTVYRTLAMLEEQGLVRRAEIVSDRGRYDANVERHHHFVCTACGRVHDVYSQSLNDLPIPPSVASIGRVESAQVQLRGVCARCAKGNH